jgi:thiamine-monophosphate kinase
MIGGFDPDDAPGWLAEMFPPAAGVLAGVGQDDCGVIETGAGLLVVSTDFINSRPILVEYGIADRSALGRLVVAHNLSDLCGSGASPVAILVGITAERDSSCDDTQQVMRGVRDACAATGVPLIGGDTKLGSSWAVFGVAIGTAPDVEALFLKSRATAGEDVWISGEIGDCCGAMLALLDRPDDPDSRQWAATAVANPVPPIGVSSAVSCDRLARAGTDISDGLAADLGDLCRSSGIGAEIEAERVPVSPRLRAFASTQQLPPWAYGLVLGGDVQFVITAPPAHRARLRELGLVRIGTTTAATGLAVRAGGTVRSIPELGHRDARNLSFGDESRELLDVVRGLGFSTAD